MTTGPPGLSGHSPSQSPNLLWMVSGVLYSPTKGIGGGLVELVYLFC